MEKETIDEQLNELAFELSKLSSNDFHARLLKWKNTLDDKVIEKANEIYTDRYHKHNRDKYAASVVSLDYCKRIIKDLKPELTDEITFWKQVEFYIGYFL